MKIISNNNRVSSKSFSVANFARTRAAVTVASAVGLLGVASSSFGAIANIQSITTHNTVGTTVSQSGITGAGASYSIYNHSNYTYTMKYLSEDDAITSVNAGSLGTYTVSGTTATVTARTFTPTSSTNNLIMWEVGTGTGANGSTTTLDGPVVTSFSSAFNSNNVLIGADNVFSNTGNPVGNNTDVARIDVLYSSGFKAGTSTAFSIFDRGPTNDHDSFKIAAITAESGGVPTAYGNLVPFNDGSWGTTSIVPPGNTTEQILRLNEASSSNKFQPSDETTQTLGGVLIQTSSLVPAGTTIYGYSLFSADVTGSGSQLVNYSAFPEADSTSTGGGLDPAATLGVLYTQTSAVPEPTSIALIAVATTGLLGRRGKRKPLTQTA